MDKIIYLLESLLNPYGFELLKKQYSSCDFGNYEVVFSNDGILARFVRDRSQVFVDISNNLGESWIDIETYLHNRNINISSPNTWDELDRLRQYVSILIDNINCLKH